MTVLLVVSLLHNLALAVYVWQLRSSKQQLLNLVKRYGRDPEWDPGPLTDDELRWTLRSSSSFPASKNLDRVQDAFDRLIREREELRRKLAQ